MFCIYHDTNNLQVCKTELYLFMETTRIFENIYVFILVFIFKITIFLFIYLYFFLLIVTKHSLGNNSFQSNKCAAEAIVYKYNKV